MMSKRSCEAKGMVTICRMFAVAHLWIELPDSSDYYAPMKSILQGGLSEAARKGGLP
jgi:hypothetical protein